jgi:hypothetical protein
MHRVVAAVALILIQSMPAARPQVQQAPARLSAEIEDLLWWLPPDTETLQITQTPQKPRGPLFDAMDHARGEIAFGDVAYADTLTRHLRPVRIKATVDGSRHFRPPAGLGEMRYEGALIFLFETPLGEIGNRLMTDLGKIALKVDEIEGLTVAEFHDTLESDVWTSYITIPRSDVLVVAWNRVYLDQLLRRRAARTGARALPSGLPEWAWLDTSAPFWAVRHYRHDDVNEDPTSPFAKTRAGDALDTAAVGVTAHATSDGRTIVAHYLSHAVDAEPIARRIWNRPGDGVTPAFRRVSKDAIEVRFTAKDEEDLSMFLFYLLAAFGHATYL